MVEAGMANCMRNTAQSFWLGFDSRTCVYIVAEFGFNSYPCSEGFSGGQFSFPLSTKTTFQILNSTRCIRLDVYEVFTSEFDFLHFLYLFCR